MQSTCNLLLIRPALFGYNHQTADSNSFQHKYSTGTDDLQQSALAEFEAVVTTLLANKVNVFVADDTPEPPKPDAVFPNNWLSLHAGGEVILYAMQAANRRPERRMDILQWLGTHFRITGITDLSANEAQGRYLEGTGSMVFDHINKVAYACLSPRTSRSLLYETAARLNYTPFTFTALNALGQALYHTNVVMCVGTGFAVVCSACIAPPERQTLLTALQRTGRQVIEISTEQMECFAGNMLEIRNREGEILLMLSATAAGALTLQQTLLLQQYARLVPVAIPIIEKTGGGSLRCMLAEIFLPEI